MAHPTAQETVAELLRDVGAKTPAEIQDLLEGVEGAAASSARQTLRLALKRGLIRRVQGPLYHAAVDENGGELVLAVLPRSVAEVIKGALVVDAE